MNPKTQRANIDKNGPAGQNRGQLRELLLTLDPETVPLWGKMKPQQMVEHLVAEVQWTNGKKACDCKRMPEEAEAGKQRMVYSEAELPKNIVNSPLPAEYFYPDIATAVDALMKELDDFDGYYQQPGAAAIHVGFGLMNHSEWLLWHSKHFTHHLKQFGLVE